MKEAFEKIRKKLDEESVMRANSEKFYSEPQNGEHVDCVVLLKDALSIVSEVEAEYGNGWIPCSERLPEDFQSVLCYAESVARSPDTIFVGSQKHGCWFLQSSIGTESFPTQYEVIAWMPLPSPYTPTTN